MTVSVELMPHDDLVPPNISARWQECVRTSSDFRACLQTPEWFGYRWNSPAKRYLAVLWDSENPTPLGVTPIVRNTYSVPFSLAGRSIGAVSFEGVLLNGNVPLFPAQGEHYRKLCNSILSMPTTECLYMLGVPTSSPFWKFLGEWRKENPDLLFYLPGHERNRYFYIDMPKSHEAYLKKFKAKTVQTFRRKMRLLEKATGAPIELEKIVDAGQVSAFLSTARQISNKSWQRWLVGIEMDQSANRQELLESFAQQGVLRCYVLKSNNHPLAYAIGFQFNKVMYFQSTAYDPNWAQFSPGQSLLYLMIKDCFESRKPEIFHFGTGEAHYKELFSNQTGDEVTLMVLKRTFANRAKISCHTLFRKGLGAIKSIRSG